MDNKTIQKVLNGQEDKLQELEQKANRTGQFHLDSINEKFAELDKKINDNNDYKKLWEENTKDYNEMASKRLNDYTQGVENSKKIDELETSIKNSDILFSDAVRKIFARFDSIEQDIPDINQETDETRALKVYCDDLESKYYKLRSELDSIYKVLEMDALDIQDLYNKLENHPKKNGVKYTLDCDNNEIVNNINLTKEGGCNDE